MIAASAVAAVILDEGRTAHSTFKIPVPFTAERTCSISARSQLVQDLLDTDFIIWDEILMCHRYCVEAVERSLQDITRRNLPFGRSACYFMETPDKFCLSISEARELRLCILAPCLHFCMQTFASYVLRRKFAFQLCETTRMRQRQCDDLLTEVPDASLD